MGRRIPSQSIVVSVHPVISFSVLAVGIAAMVTIIAALCGAHGKSRKSQTPPQTPSSSGKKDSSSPLESAPSTLTSPQNKSESARFETPETSPLVLPPAPPPLQSPTSSAPRSRRKLSTSLSMKLGGNAIARYRSRKEEQQNKPKPEDSIWKKTIILGEKCRVPSEDDEAIIYDDKGNRIASYPARTPRSLPVSRTNSFIDPDAIPK